MAAMGAKRLIKPDHGKAAVAIAIAVAELG
jgi:hypothetical protein